MRLLPKKLLSLRNLAICIDLIEHYVDHNPRQRYVEPYRINKPSELFVRHEIPSQPFNQSNNDKGCDKCGKDRVRGQDREIDRANYALTGEFGWSQAEIISSQCVMSYIADKEKSRDDARG